MNTRYSAISDSPCRHYLNTLDSERVGIGHLSLEHGLMPRRVITQRLPDYFSHWESIADDIPNLFLSQNTQATIESIPVLSADREHLPDAHLPRAAIILGIIASAYWRHGTDRFFSIRTSDIDDYLPPCILRPWGTVCQRLGRGENIYQSFDDLMMNNFRFIDNTKIDDDGRYNPEDVTIENIDTLIQSFGNEPERVFYMSFVEIHALASPIVGKICELQDDILSSDDNANARIIDAMNVIHDCIVRCIEALQKITSNPKKSTYCDPILWSKTVAIFAVPPSSYPQGATSGASVPFVHILDALIDRKDYSSHYGDYTQTAGSIFLPKEILAFLPEIQKVSLRAYIESQQVAGHPASDGLCQAFNRLVTIYAGKDGFLDKHLAKVFNYLGVATLVGRNQSTSGHERYISSETWIEVSEELHISMQERVPISTPPPEFIHTEQCPLALAPPSETIISHSELAAHHYTHDGWIAINNQVYDVTGFIDKHPGGREILVAHLGRDASKVFPMVSSHLTLSVAQRLQRMRVGTLSPAPTHPSYEPWALLLDQLLRTYAILDLQYKHDVPLAYNILFHAQTHLHFCKEHLPRIMDLISYDDNYALLEMSEKVDIHSLDWHPKLAIDLSGPLEHQDYLEINHLISSYEHSDLILISELIVKTRWIIDNMDGHAEVTDGYLFNQRFWMIQQCLRWFRSLQTTSSETTNTFLRQATFCDATA